MTALRMLDLFCGAGGAARGYQMAGFHVTGIDIKPQPRYAGDVFVQGDALDYCREHGHEYACIHASPPCQAHSAMRNLRWLHGREYLSLIDPTRDALDKTGVPWIIENVMGAPLRNAVVLCGSMFDLKLYRHRQFESNVLLLTPPHPKHTERIGGSAVDAKGGNLSRYNPANGWVSVVGHQYPIEAGKAAMQIDWMNRDELSQALPPPYCDFLGAQLLAALRNEVAA